MPGAFAGPSPARLPPITVATPLDFTKDPGAKPDGVAAVVLILRGAPETLGIKPSDVKSTYLIVEPADDPTAPGAVSLSVYVIERLRRRLHHLHRTRDRQAGELPVVVTTGCGPTPPTPLTPVKCHPNRRWWRGEWAVLWRIYRRDRMTRGVGPS